MEGDANDYVGKGLSGGRIIIYPPTTSSFAAERNILMPGASATGVVTLGVNETWNRTTGAELARAFEQALE